jgi:hypothetical protein
MDKTMPIDRRNAATLQAWLLALLRFAVTLEQTDRIVVLAAAAELDRPNPGDAHTPAFRFFYRASIAVCAAIVDPTPPGNAAVLQHHLAQITDPRLQRAFAAALEIKPSKKPQAMKRPARRFDLWKGLPPRDVRKAPVRNA